MAEQKTEDRKRPETMTAISIEAPGGPEVLKPVERPVPEPGDGEILIRVVAAGVNRPDIVQRLGRYPAPPGTTDIPGLEVAGEVVQLGTGTRRYKLGDRVTALLAGGGYAAYVTVPEVQALPIPEGLDMIEAAALPETTFTVWTNLIERGGLRAGMTALVHGGGSGIGTTAIQIATALGATVFTTAGTPDKCADCERLGARRAINYREEDFVDVIREVTDDRGVDVVLDMVAGSYVQRNLSILADDGRHVSIAFLEDPKATISIPPIMIRRLTLTGSTLRPRPVAEKGRIAAAVEANVWPMVLNNAFRPVIDTTFPLTEAANAHRHLESGAHFGKIVLTLEE